MGGWKWVKNRIHEDCLGKAELLKLSSGTSQAAYIAVLSLLRAVCMAHINKTILDFDRLTWIRFKLE